MRTLRLGLIGADVSAWQQFLTNQDLSLASGRAFGAPFWFDLLNRFVNVRASGKAPEEAPKSPRGSDWGQKGYFTMPYDYLSPDKDLADDFWTLRILEED